MNSSFKLPILAVMAAIAATSCRPDPIDLEVRKFKQKLVVNASVLPNGAITVWVTRSYGALDHSGDTVGSAFLESLLVKHARVIYSQGGVIHKLHNMEDGVYQSDPMQPVTGAVYHISIYDSVSKQSATAAAVMMSKSEIRDIETTVDRTASDTAINLKVTMADNPHEINYYMVTAYEVTDPEQITASYNMNQFGPDLNSASTLITDSDAFAELDLENFSIGDTVLVTLSNIDKQYYDFLQLRKKSANWWSELTSEAITYPTNIINGHGFFVASNPSASVIIALGTEHSITVDVN